MNKNEGAITPIFVFSLPRSGSTLTQRILATHPEIATASEPWILLPLLYMRRADGTYAEYAHHVAYKAIEDFSSGLPGGSSDLLREIKELTLRLYRARSPADAKYFVDKTPRYDLISPEIVDLFPEAKFVFLWRNPLAIISSIIETWGGGRWNLYQFEVELFEGLENLIVAHSRVGERACSVRFEDLISERSGARARLFRELGLEFDASHASRFSDVLLTGRMGDKTGIERYRELCEEPLARWKLQFGSPLRKMWCRRYIHWIGRERLAIMGYDLDELLKELDSISMQGTTIFSDILWMLFGFVVRTCEPWIMREKLARLRRGARLYMHS